MAHLVFDYALVNQFNEAFLRTILDAVYGLGGGSSSRSAAISEEALTIARKLADGPAEAIQATKRLAVAASQLTIDEGLARERAQVRLSPSPQKGLSASAQKRRPDFSRSR